MTDEKQTFNAPRYEFRNYVRRMTMDDVDKGLQGARLPIGPMVDGKQPTAMFLSVGLQVRYQRKVFLNGVKDLEWTEWETIPLVREGDDEMPAVFK